MRKMLLVTAVLWLGCVPTANTPIADIPKLTKLSDVMDNQATTIDPQFHKIGKGKYDDADFAGFKAASERLQATSTKIKDFSKGADFDALALRLNEKAKALGAAAASKNGAGAGTALAEMKTVCKECHSKFR